MKVTLDISELSEEALFAGVAEKLKEIGPVFREPERTRPFTAKEAAEALGVSERTIYRMIDEGKLPICPGMGVKMIPAYAVKAIQDGRPVEEATPSQKSDS